MRLIIIPLLFLAYASPLQASTASQQRQNRAADRYGLKRFKDRAELRSSIEQGGLVPIKGTAAYELDEGLGSSDDGHQALYRHARPWTKDFLDRELSALHEATGVRFREIHKKVEPDLTALRSEHDDKVRAILNPQQRTEYDKWRAERERQRAEDQRK